MGLAIPIETSARHIHLCREDFEILFGEGKELTFKSELSQPGQFACEERLEVRGPKGAFERVAVLGRVELDPGGFGAKRNIHMTPEQA